MGNDYTDTFGCNNVTGILSPILAKQFKPMVKNCILDGEMMCYNTKYKSFTTKGYIFLFLLYILPTIIINNIYCVNEFSLTSLYYFSNEY